MTELNALMRKHLRDTDPTPLEVWNAAARTYAQPTNPTPMPNLALEAATIANRS